jgi:hypothetical protein
MGKLIAILAAVCLTWWWFVTGHGDTGPGITFREGVIQGPSADGSRPTDGGMPPGMAIEIRDQNGNPVDLASLPPEIRNQILREAGAKLPAAGTSPEATLSPGSLAGRSAVPAKDYSYRDRDAEFQTASVRGWTVILERTLSEGNRPLANRAMATMEQQFDAIVGVLPADAVSELRQVPVWISRQSGSPRSGQYHWSAEGARQAGEDPRKEGGVDFTNVVDLIEVSEWEQPWVVLHELAHAWHHRVLGESNGMVRNAYESAKRSGSYESVKHIGGAMMRHYALENEREYFAELTEAYFGRNDFYPFNREELRKHDPTGYRMIEAAWRLPR